nr:hypothetical protein [uncultured Albidiferax sp.]
MKNQNLLLTSLVACALGSPILARAADVPVDLTYDVNTRERPVVAVRDTCPIHITPTQDARQNKETLGATFRGPLLAGDATPWIVDGLTHLKDFGFAVDKTADASPPQEGLTVKTTLTRAYTWQVGFKLFSMVALKAEFIDKNGMLQEKYYRAHGDKTNMWGADAEYVTTLNYGINNLLPVMADDLVQLCKGTKVAAFSYAGPDPAAKK